MKVSPAAICTFLWSRCPATVWKREKISMENLIINVTSAGAENLYAEMFISRKAEATITAAVNAVGLPDM